MKQYIEWKLDNEAPIDPADPLGDITFIGDKGILEEQCVFLDSFLEAFVEGLNSIKTQDISNVEIIDEPNKLMFIKNKKGLQIQYKDRTITIHDTESFSNQLSHAISSFLHLLDEASENMGKKKYDFNQLRTYVEKQSKQRH